MLHVVTEGEADDQLVAMMIMVVLVRKKKVETGEDRKSNGPEFLVLKPNEIILNKILNL